LYKTETTANNELTGSLFSLPSLSFSLRRAETRTYTILLPTLILLLDPTSTPPTPTHSLVVTNLLTLASQAPSSFRDATGTLSPEAKSILETSIRQSVESSRKVATAGMEKKVAPQIALRSFG